MSDVFISYSKEDRNRARDLATRLMQEGWSVFWDRTIPVGTTWEAILEKEINTTKVIVVLWSKTSVESKWVRKEAAEGDDRDILVPALLESVTIPFRFKSLQTADISDWKSSSPDAEGIQLLIDAVIRVGNLKKSKKASTKKVSEPVPEIVKDIDGNEYKVVKIGDQIWTAENLKVTRLNDGTPIPLVTNYKAWEELDTPGYCWYDNNIKNKHTYGALYNWYTVNTGKLSPKGWHVSTNDEWETMENYLIANGYNFDGTTTGNKIAKSLASLTNWRSSTVSGSVGNTDYAEKRNKTGFSALPGGYRDFDGAFNFIGCDGEWWSPLDHLEDSAWYWDMCHNNSSVGSYDHQKTDGFSVRCLRD